MDRIRELDRYQKAVLLILLAMAVTFAVMYAVTTSRTGFAYMDEILKPETLDGVTVYSGIIDGENAEFTVTADRTVTFRHGERLYGPYTAAQAPDAIPEDDSLAEQMTGLEVRDGNEIIFRGGMIETGISDGDFVLVDEEGRLSGISFTAQMSDGTVVDSNGNVVDMMEPSVYTVINLMRGPKLTAKGHWIVYLLCLVFSVVTALSILYADELFRMGLAFRIRNADRAEPTDWELTERYISWTILPVIILLGYLVGLG